MTCSNGTKERFEFNRRFRSIIFERPNGPRYWYSTQPTVTKLAEARVEQLKRDPDKNFGALRSA
jgi:hypothetical protein